MTTIKDNFGLQINSNAVAPSTPIHSGNAVIEEASNDLQGRTVTTEKTAEASMSAIQPSHWFANRKAVITTVAVGLLVGAAAVLYSNLHFLTGMPKNGPEQSPLLVDKIGDLLLKRLGNKEIADVPFSQFHISVKDQFSVTCRLPNAKYLTCIKIEGKLYESDTNEVMCAAHKLLRDGKIAAYIPRRVDGVEILKKGADPTKYSTAGKVYSAWFTQGVRVKEGNEDKEYEGNEKANYNDQFCADYYKRTINDTLQITN